MLVSPMHIHMGHMGMPSGGSGSGSGSLGPSGGSVGRPPLWDEQIVPTLKKRLESESIFLSNRISATSFEEPSSISTQIHSQIQRQTQTRNQHSHGNPSTTSSTACPNQIPYSPTFGPPGGQSASAASNSTFPSSSRIQAPFAAGSHPSLPGNDRSRSRTKSGPLNSGFASGIARSTTSAAAGQGQHWRPSVASQTNADSHTNNQQARTRPRLSSIVTSPTSTSSSTNLLPPPSRIPTRPRSKSQLVSRPSPIHSNSHPPPVPLTQSGRGGTGVPVSKTRSRSPQKRSSPLPLPLNSSSAYSAPSGSGSRMVVAGRASPDLNMEGRTKEGFIKNELPPFKMLPEEALRIAERGHVLQDENWDRPRGSYDSSRISEGETPRKRAITMKPGVSNENDRLAPGRRGGPGTGLGMERSGSSGSDRSGASRRNSGHGRPSTSGAAVGSKGYGISTSSTGLGLGMGHPGSHRMAGKARSGSSRSPTNGGPSLSNGFTAPRSASLNLLSHSPSMSSPQSRLGVAAHFIPPESTYTPPKGADWDEVVLPTVAKKLGIADGEKASHVQSAGGEEGELAVEWDNDGTPIRWVRGRKMGDPSNAGSAHAPTSDDTPTRTHAFSPTFEPSPDNPLHSRSRPPSLRYQRSADTIELAPLRTSTGQATSLGLGQPVSQTNSRGSGAGAGVSPQYAADSRNAYFPGQEPSLAQSLHKKPSSNLHSSKPDNGSNPSLTRKPSLLRKQPTLSVSRQNSEMSLRDRTFSQTQRANGYAPPASLSGPAGANGSVNGYTPGTTHRITDAIYENQFAQRGGPGVGAGGGAGQGLGVKGGQGGRQNQTGPASGQRNGKKVDDGTHGKGCGCLIM
ncbi:hypothetical protein IAU59_004566 [Kwoniella sp. CBS 9459]